MKRDNEFPFDVKFTSVNNKVTALFFAFHSSMCIWSLEDLMEGFMIILDKEIISR